MVSAATCYGDVCVCVFARQPCACAATLVTVTFLYVLLGSHVQRHPRLQEPGHGPALYDNIACDLRVNIYYWWLPMNNTVKYPYLHAQPRSGLLSSPGLYAGHQQPTIVEGSEVNAFSDSAGRGGVGRGGVGGCLRGP